MFFLDNDILKIWDFMLYVKDIWSVMNGDDKLVGNLILKWYYYYRVIVI